jgi:hypothetical protein
VHKVSQVGAEQASIELQVVILEWLGAAANLAVHLAQVSQVDQVPWVCQCGSGDDRQQGRQGRQAHFAGGIGSWLHIF